MSTRKIVVIGGGMSGTLAAIYLSKKTKDDEIIIIEKISGRLFRGIPYSSDLTYQPLNVNARGMTLFDDEPEHFINWLKAHRDEYPEFKDHEPKGTDFIKRKIFGDYLENTFKEANAGNTIKILDEEVVDIIDSGGGKYMLSLSDGTRVNADKIVLALGNFPPSDPTFLRGTKVVSDPGYVSHPWAGDSLEGIEKNDPVLFIGSGLTMVDLAISLMKTGHTGPLYVISRRGFLSLSHEETPPYQLQQDYSFIPTTLELFRKVRKEIELANAAGNNWRGVVDSLRPITQKLWINLLPEERQRFLSHVRPYWDIMRHRMPVESHNILDEALKSGTIKLMAARIRTVERVGDELHVTYLKHGGKESGSLIAKRIINCTGPQSDYRKLDQPLVMNLFSKGWISPDELFLGIKTDANGKIIDRSGKISRPLFAVGPPCKGSLWECIALRDIRQQINRLVPEILAN